MSSIFDSKKDPCADFLAHLDQWLAHELDAHDCVDMQLHHDACDACQLEARMARSIDLVVRTLPEKVCPALPLPATPRADEYGFMSRLLAAWRQPLVFVPAFAALLAALVLTQLRVKPEESRSVVINGEEYTQEEIMQAAQELETALRYLDRYSSLPARVVTTEIEESHLPLPSAETADVPTI